MPDRSGPREREHGHAQHREDELGGMDWSENELALESREELDPRPARGHSYWSLSVRRLMRKKLAVICLSLIVFMYGGALLSPLITPYEYTAQDLSQSRAGPTLAHPFGADRLGRDMLTRVIYGLRTTVIITLASLLGGTLVLGVVLGLMSGYMGRWVDSVIMRTGEVTSSFPDIILILIFVAALRPRLLGAVQGFEDATGIDWIIRLGLLDYAIISVALSIFGWFGMARLVRGQVLQARESQYTEAALVAGASTARILRAHVLPNILSPLIVSISAGLAGVAGSELVLSWIGIGVQPPVPSLGRMMFENGSIQVLRNEPHLILFPIGTVTLLFFCFNILGDAGERRVQPAGAVAGGPFRPGKAPGAAGGRTEECPASVDTAARWSNDPGARGDGLRLAEQHGPPRRWGDTVRLGIEQAAGAVQECPDCAGIGTIRSFTKRSQKLRGFSRHLYKRPIGLRAINNDGAGPMAPPNHPWNAVMPISAWRPRIKSLPRGSVRAAGSEEVEGEG